MEQTSYKVAAPAKIGVLQRLRRMPAPCFRKSITGAVVEKFPIRRVMIPSVCLFVRRAQISSGLTDGGNFVRISAPRCRSGRKGIITMKKKIIAVILTSSACCIGMRLQQ